MGKPLLTLLVLRAADVSRSLVFYKMLGFEFTEERHGTGPVHYSCEVGGVVVEIFPGKPGHTPDRRDSGATLIGFQVADLDQIVAAMKASGATIITDVQDSTWGRRAIIQDPDGRAIELNQAKEQ
jgi:predicted enzyme related to lactoylglutathione lyase